MSIRTAVFAGGMSLLSAAPALAHFVTIYTPDLIVEPGIIPVELVFWHPLFTGAVLDMQRPQQFFLTHRGQEVSLLDRLQPIEFRSWTNSGKAFHADVPLDVPGDYVLTVVPEPYFEAAEDSYIQQIAKTYINVGQEPLDWYRPLGLKAEIVPINRPYEVFAGSTFSGVVLSNGVPVPGAEIEVEYLAALPDVHTHSTGRPTVKAPAATITTYSDANGQFTFGIPRAGWWGFAALGVGPDYEFNGKPLSQDAVLWVVASEFGK
jgi:cobalt/nickel transport protein